MPLPPEHISIKRRRQEEPVDLLYLENDRHQTKRRVTDYCFQRLKAHVKPYPLAEQRPKNAFQENHAAASSNAATGIPVVRATSPGAEVRDEAERRAAQRALRARYLPREELSNTIAPPLNDLPTVIQPNIFEQPSSPTRPSRRFHLYHDYKPKQSHYPSAVRKRKTARRNYLATFIERAETSRHGAKLQDSAANGQSTSCSQSDVVERSINGQSLEGGLDSAANSILKTANSVHHDPSTPDCDSDQLAEELAAFALELSQNEKQEKRRSEYHDIRPRYIQDINVLADEDFVYDTYIRVSADAGANPPEATNEVGFLVIDDKDQELWQAYNESESDSEWDEDDPDSNAEDNPANEYPDEEVDSEDEHGYGSYKNRKVASDDEEYDLNDT